MNNKARNPKTFKYETHMHTKEASACSSSTGAEMVRAHAAARYSGIIVTDHFLNGNTAVPSNLPWETRIELFCRGYESALEEARGTGFHVFFGWEYAYDGTEFLTYGLDKSFLLSYPDMLSWSIEKYFDIVHRHGGFISHAHPYREAPYISTIRLFPEYVDAVEVVNASHRNADFDLKALAFAREHSLPQTSGSDSHHVHMLYGGGMEFDCELNTIEEFIQAVKEEKYCGLLRGI
jgi:hypothetical protein